MKSESVGATFTAPIRVEIREPQHIVAEGTPDGVAEAAEANLEGIIPELSPRLI